MNTSGKLKAFNTTPKKQKTVLNIFPRNQRFHAHKKSVAENVPQFFRLYDEHNAASSTLLSKSIYTKASNDIMKKNLKGRTFLLSVINLQTAVDNKT